MSRPLHVVLCLNWYLTRSIQFDEFIAVVPSIKSFWLQFVKLRAQGG